MRNKIILLGFSAIACFSAGAIHAQTQVGRVNRIVERTTKTHDTLTDADTIQYVLPVTAGYESLAIQVVLTKLSGTAGGKIYIEKSLDQSNWFHLDSTALTDITTNAFFYTYTGTPFQYVRITQRTAGTQALRSRTYFVVKGKMVIQH